MKTNISALTRIVAAYFEAVDRFYLTLDGVLGADEPRGHLSAYIDVYRICVSAPIGDRWRISIEEIDPEDAGTLAFYCSTADRVGAVVERIAQRSDSARGAAA